MSGKNTTYAECHFCSFCKGEKIMNMKHSLRYKPKLNISMRFVNGGVA